VPAAAFALCAVRTAIFTFPTSRSPAFRVTLKRVFEIRPEPPVTALNCGRSEGR
jgi:hypothetical protein